jgi:excisionase family DNA binding protein
VTAADPLLTPPEVAALFRVTTKTINRWTIQGRLQAITTPGGHHRYYKSYIDRLLWREP